MPIAACSWLSALKNSTSEPNVSATPAISSQLSSVRPPSSADIGFAVGTLEVRCLADGARAALPRLKMLVKRPHTPPEAGAAAAEAPLPPKPFDPAPLSDADEAVVLACPNGEGDGFFVSSPGRAGV